MSKWWPTKKCLECGNTLTMKSEKWKPGTECPNCGSTNMQEVNE